MKKCQSDGLKFAERFVNGISDSISWWVARRTLRKLN